MNFRTLMEALLRAVRHHSETDGISPGLPASFVARVRATLREGLELCRQGVLRGSVPKEIPLPSHGDSRAHLAGWLTDFLHWELVGRVWCGLLAEATVVTESPIQGTPPAALSTGNRWGSVADSLHRELIAVRKLALSIMLAEGKLDLPSQSRIQKCRQRTERWTDLILAGFPSSSLVTRYAIDPSRSREFRGKSGLSAAEQSHFWNLIASGLRSGISTGLVTEPTLRKLCATMVGLFNETVTGVGEPKSPPATRPDGTLPPLRATRPFPFGPPPSLN